MKDRLENQYMEFVKVEAQTETTQMLLGHGMSESEYFLMLAILRSIDDQSSERECSPLSTELLILAGLK